MQRSAGRPKKIRRGRRSTTTTAQPTSSKVGESLGPASDGAIDGVSCVAAASTHQGGPRFAGEGQGAQCVAMSTCASVISVIKKRQIFQQTDMDNILDAGHALYPVVPRPEGERFICPEDLPTHIKVPNFDVDISVTYTHSALYPSQMCDLDNSLQELSNLIHNLMCNEQDDTTSYLFTGQHQTVSFWRFRNEYYLFNSHGVDPTGLYNTNDNTLNVARLFRCHDSLSLARLLLGNCSFQGVNQYDIHKLTVIKYLPRNLNPIVLLTRLPEINLKRKIDTVGVDPKLSMNPVVIIERTAAAVVEDKLINVGGRPKKICKGPKKTVSNPHLVAVNKYRASNPECNRKAVQRYSQANPTVNREAVERYTRANPEVNREAVQRYSQNNPEINRLASQRYNTVRNVDESLRVSKSLIAVRSGDDLNTVPLFSLKRQSLKEHDAYRCSHCNATLFFEEKARTQWCCGSGKYNVQNFPPLTENFYDGRPFNDRPRAYNNLFAFSALGVSHGFQNPDSGLAFVKIQGRIYHRVFDLGYRDTQNPIGLYIEDHEERQRIASGQRLDRQTVTEINNFMHSVNPYIDCFKQLARETSDDAYLRFEATSRRTHGNILGDMPLGNEIAAIISTEREEFSPRCIAIWKIGNRRPHQVDYFNPLYESFQYPLLYPHGTPGWTINKQTNDGSKLSQNKYVRCLLLSEARFVDYGRLSEEWVVDMYCRVEEERLRYILNIQNKTDLLRSAPFNEIRNNEREFVGDETVQGEGGIVPGRVYLPNTFTGGPRYMKTKYMDAIAIVNRLGTPSFFLTVTCNPKWSEIQKSLAPGQKPYPSLCARVFNLKLTQLLRDIRSGTWFGKCTYIIHVIEFQKRGLPHAHICFRVDGGGPIQNTDIDKFVRADIPSADEAEGRLRQAVLNHMIHGPCGPPHRTDLPCWDNEKSKCSKFFPKNATDVTYTDDKGFVRLRRDANNSGTIRFRNRPVEVSDLWVVPYNAAILLKYDCHANLEVSSAHKVIKYLFKYITKGKDETRVAMVTGDQNDEVENYVTKRYIGSCDAAWRIFEFDITAREPTVQQLTVHLEGAHNVVFRANAASDAADNSCSTLMLYFARPTGPEFDNLTYLDFYERYIVHTQRPKSNRVEVHQIMNKFITKRQRGENVTRLFWVAPNRGEQFYLRMLLALYPCRGYNDLLNFGGPDCKTFQEVAKNVGIANDEQEYQRAIQEAATFFTGPRLRSFFVLLAVNGAPAALLWETSKNLICEDFIERCPNDTERAYKLALVQIDRLLRKHGTNLVAQGLPDVPDDTTELIREQMSEFSTVQLHAFVERWLPVLSQDQREIFDYVDQLLKDPVYHSTNNNAIFVDGPAGTGKTLLLNVVASHVRGSLGGVVLCTATSGIAAQNYVGGTTAHSMFKFPLDIVDDLGYWNITNGTQRAELIYHASVIIYDEAPMAHKYLVHLLDRSLRDLMKSDRLFGGKVIIFAGDFRQIPPVVTNARSNADVINCSLKSSHIWPQLKCFALSTAQRSRDDPEFSEFLLNIGSNNIQSEPIDSGRNITNLINVSNVNYVTEVYFFIDSVFPTECLNDPDICCQRAILCTHNNGVREINNIVLNRVSGELLHFFSVDKTVADNADEIFLGTDTLNKAQPKGIPEHDLQLKIGSVCMVMRNLSFSDRLVNGTKVIVVAASPRLITVRKPNEHELYFIPRISFKAPIATNSPIEMLRRQFPLQVCYAMTIHKSQGQTINRVGVDLRSDVFSHGQLYVALGRVRNRNDLTILINRDRVVNNHPYVNNVVFPELLGRM